MNMLSKYTMWFKSYQCLTMTCRTCHRLANKSLDNVKMCKYAIFDQNIWCSSRVMMSIFTKNPSTGQNDAWQSLITILYTNVWNMLK